MNNRTIDINHSLFYFVGRRNKTGNEWVINKPKTDSGVRTIPMVDTVYAAFIEEKARQEEEGTFCISVVDDMSGFIFCNRFRELYVPESINRNLRRVIENHNTMEEVKAAKEKREAIILPQFSCHHLRHTFCARLCEADVNIKVIQSIMECTGGVSMDIQNLSSQYTVRELRPEDAAMVYEVLKHNTIFYQYHPPMVTVDSIIEDMKALPPGKSYEDKHYIGFFQDGSLIAVMDLIENYPRPKTALIGFFAMNTDFQGKSIGTAIISDSADHLAQLGFDKVRLGIDKGNPQSKAFWTKNGFGLTGEVFPNDHSSYFMMERTL